MAVNAVAFAFTCLHLQNGKSAPATLAEFINFAFETSGISCSEKIDRWNATHNPIVADAQLASDFYNELATEAAFDCQYFAGTKQLLGKTKELECLNFITSAVHQDYIDEWGRGEQAAYILPLLTEVLGYRSINVSKGRGHFNYVREFYEVERIIYIADAVSEIADGHKNRDEFGVLPIGFANFITPENVARAFDTVLEAYVTVSELPSGDLSHFNLVFDKLKLPDQSSQEQALKEAGAEYVVGGLADELMGNLNLLLARKIL